MRVIVRMQYIIKGELNWIIIIGVCSKTYVSSMYVGILPMFNLKMITIARTTKAIGNWR